MLSALIPITACIARTKTLNRQLRVLFLYCILSALTELINYLLAVNGTHNYPVRNIFTIAECNLILFIYFLQFEEMKIRVLIFSFFILFAFLCVFVLISKGLNQNDNILTSCESCFFIILPLIYFYKDFVERNVPLFTEDRFFWINSAFMVYFGISFFLFLFSGFIEKTDAVVFKFFKGVYLVTNISYNVFLSLGVWKTKESS